MTQKNNEPSDGVLVVGICGSLRPGSYSHSALRIALKGAQEVGAATKLIDLREYQLIHCDGKEDESRYPPKTYSGSEKRSTRRRGSFWRHRNTTAASVGY
ncbi:MAG: NAD(P)H-dependent oxidoreductase [Nitrospira sp.]